MADLVALKIWEVWRDIWRELCKVVFGLVQESNRTGD